MTRTTLGVGAEFGEQTTARHASAQIACTQSQARAQHMTRQIEPEDASVVIQTSPASLSTRIPTWVSNRNRENTKRSLTRRKMAAPRLQPANSGKAEFRSLLWPTRSDQRRSSRFQLGLRGNNVSACSKWHESNQP